MKIAITGALGHIGSYIIHNQNTIFDDYVLIDNLLTQRYCSLFCLPVTSNYKFYEADVRNGDLPFKDVDCVLHLAARTDATSSINYGWEFIKYNTECTKNVIDSCLKYDVPLIFISSTSVYGDNSSIVDENSLLNPQSPYADGKIQEEELIKSSLKRFVILRFGTIAGVSRGMRFHTAVNKFCWQASFGLPITVWKTALYQKRPYLDLMDAYGVIKFIIEENLFTKEVYNIVTSNLTVNDILSYIKDQLPVNVEFVDSRIMNQLSYEVSTKKIEDCGMVFSGDINHCVIKTIRYLYHG